MLRDQVHERMEASLFEQPVEHFIWSLNEVHDALIQRTIALIGSGIGTEGEGSPPVPYAYLLFGSGGRRRADVIERSGQRFYI